MPVGVGRVDLGARVQQERAHVEVALGGRRGERGAAVGRARARRRAGVEEQRNYVGVAADGRAVEQRAPVRLRLERGARIQQRHSGVVVAGKHGYVQRGEALPVGGVNNCGVDQILVVQQRAHEVAAAVERREVQQRALVVGEPQQARNVTAAVEQR